jgi:hypothetical protein
MPRYESQDVAFDVPRDWEDRSVVAFASPTAASSGPAPNVVLTRESLEASDTIASYADRQLVELAKRLEGFELVERRDFALAGLPAVELRFSWHGEATKLTQRMLLVADRRRAAFSVTATSATAEMSRNDATFDRVFSSLRFPS